MKYLLGLIVAVSLLAQEPAQEAKPAEEAAAESPAPAGEQNFTGVIDVGNRWLADVRGDFDTYRSVVDVGEGPRLLNADFAIRDPKGRVFDRIDVHGVGWGGDPYNTARVYARRNGWYNFTADYRNLAYFNRLPSFANPGADGGSLFLNQRAFDIQRRFSNFELDLMPGGRIVPFLGYSRDSGFGRGITDFVASGNEYPVATSINDSMNRFRGGVRLDFSRFHVTLEQGGTTFKDDQLVFTSDRNPGNRTTPLLGQNLFLSDLHQAYGIRGDSIYTKVIATANPASWINLYGQFLFSQPKTDVNYSAAAAGNFSILSQLLFYPGGLESASGVAKQPRTSGSAGFEIRPFRRLRIIQSYSTDRLHNASFVAVAETLLLGANNTQQLAPALFNDRLVWNYNVEQVDALFDVTSRFTLRGGYRYVWGDASNRAPTLFADATGLESTRLKRHVGIGGATYRIGTNFRINAEFEGAAAEHSFFRTSLYNYRRSRIGARYQVLTSLGLGANFRVLSNENPSPTVNYDFLSRDNSAFVYWTPQGKLKAINLTGEYTRSSLRSEITYLNPTSLTRELSFYRDNAHMASAMLEIAVPGAYSPRIGVGGSLFRSSGSRPTEYYQPLLRAAVPVHRNVQGIAEWRYYGLAETFYKYEGFNTHLFTIGLRILR
jgi:hypothetical protein